MFKKNIIHLLTSCIMKTYGAVPDVANQIENYFRGCLENYKKRDRKLDSVYGA